MAKLLRQNVGGVNYTMAGCALTGVCPTAAADYVKQITLSDGDVIEDGMMVVVTFANGNTAGNAPNAKTIYSSDQVNYFEDDQLTIPFTLAPSGCYEIEYTGTANAYTYIDYPVFQVGSVSGPVCDYRGHIASGDLWNAGDSVQCMLKEGKFLLLGGSGGTDIDVYDTLQDAIDDLPNLDVDQIIATEDTGAELAQPVNVVESGNLHAVTSNAVAGALSDYFSKTPTQIDNVDLNNLTDAGFYFSNGVDSLQNKPLNSAYNNIILVLRQGNAGRYEQIFYSINDNTYWYRYYSSSWGAWQKVTCLKEKQIRIDDTSGYSLENGVYVKTLSGFFADNGISYSKVVNIRQVNNGNNLYPYFFIAYGSGDYLKVFKFADVNNSYIDVKVYYE